MSLGISYTIFPYRGYSQQVRVKCFPDLLDLGTVPICVPQNRLVLLMNPLAVPITIQCTVPEDGKETPLILNVSNTDEYLPIHVKDPNYEIKESDVSIHNSVRSNGRETTSRTVSLAMESSEDSLMTYHSMMMDDNSSLTSYSMEFQEQTLGK